MQHPLSVEAIAAWLATKPAETSYDYCDIKNCLHHQYLTHCGFNVEDVSDFRWIESSGKAHLLSKDFKDIAVYKPWTYGAALARANHILAGNKAVELAE